MKTNTSYQKKGNNTLFLVAGLLTVVLLGLIYAGGARQSTVSQLIDAAAPDSSAYANDSELMVPEAVPEPEPEPEKVVEKPVSPVDTATKTVPKNQPTDTTAPSPATPSEPIKVQESGDVTIYSYKVKRGDTMYKIAARYGNKPSDVMALNGMADMNLSADKDLKVKIKGIHSVADGEGLNAIAQKYSIPVRSLKVANDLTSDILPDGSQLIIPLK